MWIALAILSMVHAKSMNIAIDAGHGGSDHGATYKQVHESKITLGIAKELQKIVENDDQFSSFLVRDDDTSIELHDRVKKARSNDSDLFISIHANSSPDPGSHGMEIYFRNELEPDQESLRLAHQENQFKSVKSSQKLSDIQSITQDLNRSTTAIRSYELSWHIVDHWRVPFSSKRKQPIKQGPFHVIHQGIPSVLVEVGFVTNDKEAMRLSSPAYQKETAMAIYKGLKDYKETLDKGQTKALK
jgi:N-acetylmuramoyl-L-alanine amidase